MAESEQRIAQSRTVATDSVSQRSGTSRPPSPDGLTRITSANFLADHSSYCQHHTAHTDTEFQNAVDDDESSNGDNTELTEKDTEDIQGGKGTPQGEGLDRIVSEVRMGIPDQHDIEASRKLERKKTSRSTRSARDPNLVGWDGLSDPENPKNWPSGRKWAATFVVSSFTFISPVSSSMVAPALTAIGTEFNVCAEPLLSVVVSQMLTWYRLLQKQNSH